MKSIIVFFYMVSYTVAVSQQTGKWGDQGDGTYRNPVIAGDFSNPDVVRVGDNYYMVSSANQFSPGIQVLHSKDLINWKIVGAAFNDVSLLGSNFNWDKMNNYRAGLYAPSITYHDGKFWVFANCYRGEGFWMSTAKHPAGPWTPVQIKDRDGVALRTSGWTDPFPFWDDDGNAYLAASDPGNKWYNYLFRMTPDGTQLLDADFNYMAQKNTVHEYEKGRGTIISAFRSSEGNKIYKRNGYYYIFHIEFLNDGRGCGTYVYRSKNIYGTKANGEPGRPGDAGDYELYKIGEDDCKGGSLPGQGSLINTPDDRWFWIGQFNYGSTGGRTPVLLPVTWVSDWPVIGTDVKGLHGKMNWQLTKPILGHAFVLPQGNDEFNKKILHSQWLWNHQPRADKWSLKKRKGYLRLYAFCQLEKGKFFKTGNLLCQRYLQSDSVTITTSIDLSDMADGQEAGLSHTQSDKQDYAAIVLVMDKKEKKIKYEENGTVSETLVLPEIKKIWLQSTVGFRGINQYAYSTDGKHYKTFGAAYVLKQGNHSDMIGLFTFNNRAEKGYIDIDWVHYEIKNK